MKQKLLFTPVSSFSYLQASPSMSATPTDLGLRQRNKGSPESSSTGEKTEKYVEAVADQVPGALKPYLLKAAPYFGIAATYVEKAIPLIHELYVRAVELWAKLAPYKPQLLLPAFAGLIMCFFGGSFVTLIAAVEAYRMCGYETSVRCVTDIYEDFEKFIEANKEDDNKDEDHNGKPDILEMSKQELVTRKTLLFLKTVDPKKLTDAIVGLNSGFLAVVATLKLQFAKAIALGNAIGGIIEKPAKK